MKNSRKQAKKKTITGQTSSGSYNVVLYKTYNHKAQWNSAHQKKHFLKKSKEEREPYRIRRYKRFLSESAGLGRRKYPTALLSELTNPMKDIKQLGTIKSAQNLLSLYEKRRIYKLAKYVIPSTSSELQIQYQVEKPMIIISFLDGIKKRVSFMSILKSVREKPIFPQADFIFQIFGRLYQQVPNQFWPLQKFAFLGANSNSFPEQSLHGYGQNYKLLYGYSKLENIISFILINQHNQSVSFSSARVQGFKESHVELYRMYQNFKKSSIDQIEDNQNWNFSGYGELDSDEEYQNQGKQMNLSKTKKIKINDQVAELKDKITKIMRRDMGFYQGLVEKMSLKKQNQLSEKVSEFQEDNMEFQKKLIFEQFDEAKQLQSAIHDFKEAVVEAQRGLNDAKKNHNHKKKIYEIYCGVLRKLIFTEKQLTSQLPILKYKKKILSLLKFENLILLEGETGSGKSTQLPQILYLHYKNQYKDQFLPILITQPRKLAVRTLSQRIAFEMNQQKSQLIQYQASYNNRTLIQDAKIYIKLDRIVLDEISIDPLLSKYSCLVIDEAHERTLCIDLILGHIKNILENRKDFKVIITSASMDTKLLQEYFGIKQSLKIPGRVYPIQQKYFPLINIKTIKEKIKFIISRQIMQNDGQTIKPKYRGHILVFCPGLEQINQLKTYYSQKLNPDKYKVLSLHQKLTPKEQNEVFKDTRKIKLMFSTSLSETSVTINRVKTVIDSGYERVLVYDSKSRMYSMTQKIIDESSAKQRAGRAGRTNKGVCFRLYSKSIEIQMLEHRQPQIINISLDTLVLRLKVLMILNLNDFPYLTKPQSKQLNRSQELMKAINCLDDQGIITPIGRILSKVPIQPIISRSIIESYFYSQALKCEEKLANFKNTDLIHQVILTLSMILNSSNLKTDRMELREKKKQLQKIQNQSLEPISGDFIYLREIIHQFIELKQKKQFDQLEILQNKYHLSIIGLVQSLKTAKQVHSILKAFYFNKSKFVEEIQRCKANFSKFNNQNQCIVACLISGFIGNLCLYSGNPEIGYTFLNQEQRVQLNKSSILYQQSYYPKWIICYDLFLNSDGVSEFKIAQGVNLQQIIRTIPKKLLQIYHLSETDNKNPYYENYRQKLPTIIFRQFYTHYKKCMKRRSQKKKYLSNINVVFKEDENLIHVFYQPKYFLDDSQSPQKQIQYQLKQINKRFDKNYKYQYMGNIWIKFKDGLVIEDSSSFCQNDTKSCFKITCSRTKYCDEMFDSCLKYSKKIRRNKKQLFIQLKDQEQREPFQEMIHKKQQKYVNRIKIQEQYPTKLKKIPTSRLTINFYIGSCPKNNMIFMNYKSNQSPCYQETTIKMAVQLINSQMQLIENEDECLFRWIDIVPSKSLSGINLYLEESLKMFDQFQIQQLFKEYINQGIISQQFQMPLRFIKFRVPSSNYRSDFSLQDWQELIDEKFDELGANRNSYQIKMQGKVYLHNSKAKCADQKNSFTNISANVESFNSQYLQKFASKYNNRTGILGSGILHAKFEYTYIGAIVRINAFQALNQQYKQLVKQIREQDPSIQFGQSHIIKVKKVDRILIKIHSQTRGSLSTISRRVAQLFKPFIWKIDRKYEHFFQPKNQFQKQTLIQSIEAEANLKIYIIYDKIFSSLFIYCRKQLYAMVRQKIQYAWSIQDIHCEAISYKNISLMSIQRVTQEILSKINTKDQQNKQICISQPRYSKREVLITSEPQILQQIKHKISLIQKQEVVQCAICCGQFQQPYNLFNCDHSFCRSCLKQFIRESLGNQQAINCPLMCGQQLSVYDIQSILDYQQFIRICDITIRRFVQGNKNLFLCYSTDCEHIVFQDPEVLSYECPCCGKQYCKICKNQHPGQSCQEFERRQKQARQFLTKLQKQKKQQQEINVVLKQLGGKRCPSCKLGIQKNRGCNHMICPNCKSHLCWICLQIFSKPKQCYTHLTKQHGGIFDDEQVRRINMEVQ